MIKMTLIWTLLGVLGGLISRTHSQGSNQDLQSLPDHSNEINNIKQESSSLQFIYAMKNYSRVVGDALKIKCEVSGNPGATEFHWFKNEAPFYEEKGRIKIKEKLGGTDPQWSRIRFRELEVMDTGFYRCEASNGQTTISGETIIRVAPSGGKKTSHYDEDVYSEDYEEDRLIPHDFPIDFGADLSNGVHGIPSHIQFQEPGNARRPPDRSSPSKQVNSGLPSLKPNEMDGSCQRYTGSICSQYVGGSDLIFISAGLTQDYIELKLQAALQVIMKSPDLRGTCAEYAIPAICLSTLPLCDRQTKKPRKVCRDECEVLEYDICQKELEIARSQPMINHQLVLPDCKELPVTGSTASYNCVRLSMPHVTQLIKPHSCYKDSGEDYRGTISVTKSGLICKPWHLSFDSTAVGLGRSKSDQNVELVGGHNYCRNPAGQEQESQPWCYTNDPRRPKEVCGIPRCSDENLWLYIVLPALGALCLVLVILVLCCLRRKQKKPLASLNGSASPRSMVTTTQASSHHNYSEMEMNSLIPPHTLPIPPSMQPYHPPKPRAREFPITSVRFNQELGEGAYGKIYRGDLGGIIGGGSTQVAIKTLRPGANSQIKQDFQKEIDSWSDIKSANVVMLIGVVLNDDPQCLIFEYLSHGDLHEFLVHHSPKSDMSISSDDGMDRVLDPADMSFIAIQISAGMEYLASRNYVHRDLAARNCLVGENLTVKISDFGLAREMYASDYYRVQAKSMLPVRWMPPESILYGTFNSESDVWSYGVVLWEIYSFGLQPYYGYSNQEVIEMIRSRQLLPCPEDCPSRMYAFMVECWHEVPNRRPPFAEINARLRHWEGMSNGYQSTSHSMANTSQHSGSQHSSTGPSNNTGSTNVSQQHLLMQQQQQANNAGSGTLTSSNGGYSQPFSHLINPFIMPNPPQHNHSNPPSGAVGMVQMGHNGGPPQHTLFMPNGGGHTNNGAAGSSVASLQMV